MENLLIGFYAVRRPLLMDDEVADFAEQGFPIRITGNKFLDGFICIGMVFIGLFAIGFAVGVTFGLWDKLF